MNLVEMFCHVDDFCQEFEPKWKQKQIETGDWKRNRKSRLSLSEVMSIVIYFHQSNYRTFKADYLQHVCKHLQEEFPISVKRETRWIGYKVHFTETCEKEHPGLITQVETTNSCIHDVK